MNEGCGEFVWFNLPGHEPLKLCGGETRADLTLRAGAYFVRLIGGSGAGWGLYRYTPNTHKLDFHNFNAREVTVTKWDNQGVWLQVNYAVHKLECCGYDPDKVTQWYWAADEAEPHRVDK